MRTRPLVGSTYNLNGQEVSRATPRGRTKRNKLMARVDFPLPKTWLSKDNFIGQEMYLFVLEGPLAPLLSAKKKLRQEQQVDLAHI